MVRRSLIALAFATLGGSAMAFVAPVSAYDFDNTLNPFWATNAHVGPLEYRTGGGPSSSAGTPTFHADNVGGHAKQVVEIAPGNFFLRALHGIGKNGGGSYVNQYSLMMDVNFRRTNEGWASLYNTTADNTGSGTTGDGESFVQWGVGVGISGVYGGNIPSNEWMRLVITASASGGTTSLNYYLNGSLVNSVSGGSGLDGRWTLYSWDDPDAEDHVDMFADNDGDNTPSWVSQLAFFDRALAGDEVAALGGVGTVVPEPATLAVLGLGVLALRRRKR